MAAADSPHSSYPASTILAWKAKMAQAIAFYMTAMTLVMVRDLLLAGKKTMPFRTPQNTAIPAILCTVKQSDDYYGCS